VIFDEVIFDEVIFDEVIFDEVINSPISCFQWKVRNIRFANERTFGNEKMCLLIFLLSSSFT
jgi:hypothetical protein